MTDPKEWKEPDLQRLIADGVEESVTLDYKGCDFFRKDDHKGISKHVSAFANSAGGTVVLGIIEDEDKRKPKTIDTGYDPREVSKETLENVINTVIHRRIEGLFINPVELKSQSPGRYAYVICIPQSDRAPHQASDKKYYKRFNFQSVPMEEYEVRDLMFRQRVPIVTLASLRIEPFEPEDRKESRVWVYYLEPIVRNDGRTVAHQYGLEVRIPEPLDGYWGVRPEDKERRRKDGKDWVLFQQGTGPLFPSQKKVLHQFRVKVRSESILEGIVPEISVICYADDMPPRTVPYNILDQDDVWNHFLVIDKDFCIRAKEKWNQRVRCP